MDLETGKKEIGQFKISKAMPRKQEDIEDYKRGISEEWRQSIFQWAVSQNKDLPQIKNWDALNYEWSMNEKWGIR
jgi:hypothetical protein